MGKGRHSCRPFFHSTAVLRDEVIGALQQPFRVASVFAAALAFVTVLLVVHPQPEGKVKTTFINLGQVDGSFRWLAD